MIMAPEPRSGAPKPIEDVPAKKLLNGAVFARRTMMGLAMTSAAPTATMIRGNPRACDCAGPLRMSTGLSLAACQARTAAAAADPTRAQAPETSTLRRLKGWFSKTPA